MKFQSVIIFLILLAACQNRQHQPVVSTPVKTDSQQVLPVNKPGTTQPESRLDKQDHEEHPDTTILGEFFADSLHIGKRKHNKIELFSYRNADSNYVVIKFYAKAANKWLLQQTFAYEKYGSVSSQPKFSDYNNDAYNDLTYVSGQAARGANEIRRLLLYDPNKDRLISMKNAEDYPNLMYNKELNCIDAWLVYGGSSTVFLKIKGDSLIEFAGVSLDDSLTVYEIDKKGQRKIIKQDTAAEWRYIRFKNYKPLVVADGF
jgi:hypothetical protein